MRGASLTSCTENLQGVRVTVQAALRLTFQLLPKYDLPTGRPQWWPDQACKVAYVMGLKTYFSQLHGQRFSPQVFRVLYARGGSLVRLDPGVSSLEGAPQSFFLL